MEYTVGPSKSANNTEMFPCLDAIMFIEFNDITYCLIITEVTLNDMSK